MNHSIRNAAIVVASMDADVAEKLLDQLAPAHAARVRQALATLGNVHPDERHQAIRQFMQSENAGRQQPPSGVELSGTLQERLAAQAPDLETQPPTTPAIQNENAPHHFRFLTDANVTQVARCLENERPQTIAVVLSCLPAERGAGILAALNRSLQLQVVRRLAELDETDQESIRAVEDHLQEWVKQNCHATEPRSAGWLALQGILNVAGATQKDSLLDGLRQHDALLATRITGPYHQGHQHHNKHPVDDFHNEQLRPSSTPAPVVHPQPIPFKHFQHQDDACLKGVFGEANSQLVLLALAGAEQPLVKRVLAQLPKSDARALRRGIKRLGPTRVSDVEMAQEELVSLALQLENSEQVTLHRLSETPKNQAVLSP